MFLSKKRKETPEQRLAYLEAVVEQQGHAMGVMLLLTVIFTIVVVVIWEGETKPNYDHIAVALTIFQTFFALAALYGFWALRGLTKEKAEEVAEVVAEKAAKIAASAAAEKVARDTVAATVKDEVAELAPPLIRREFRTIMETNGVPGTMSDDGIGKLMQSLDEKEGDNAK